MNNTVENENPNFIEKLSCEMNQINMILNQMQDQVERQHRVFDEKLKGLEEMLDTVLRAFDELNSLGPPMIEQAPVARPLPPPENIPMTSMHPCTALNKLCQSQLFFQYGATGTGDDSEVLVTLDLAGRTFSAGGINAREARTAIAIEALEYLAQLETLPVWRYIKTPSSRLNNLFPNAQYVYEPYKNHLISGFIATVVVNEFSFYGLGYSKKDAKNAAAAVALYTFQIPFQ